MVEEDYVSFELAKLLKEKGFPQDTNEHKEYYTPGGKIMSCLGKLYDKDIDYSMASLSLVQKWLRDEKNIMIEVAPIYNIEDKFQGYHCELYIDYKNKCIWETLQTKNTYEEALEAGINKALEFI